MTLALAIILIILIFLICGDKGTRSIVSVILNAALLLLALFLIYRGAPPVPVTLLTCVAASAITLYYPEDRGDSDGAVKTHAAFLSVLIVMAVMIPVVFFFADHANAAGFNPEAYETTDSNGYTRNIGVSMLSLYISVMFIALIGTVTDTAVAITSSVQEIRNNNRSLSPGELLASSFVVGRSVLSTSIHTIFYIYIAEYLTLMIQYISDYSFAYVINSKSLAHELIAVSVSGMGCCLVVPVAALISARMTRDTRA